MYMDSGGVHDTPLYLLSKGEKRNKFLRKCCQQFQRGRLLSTVQQCCHYCQHDQISVHKVHMVAHVKEITSTRSTKLSDVKTTKGPKVVMRYQKLSRGPNYKRKVMDSQR